MKQLKQSHQFYIWEEYEFYLHLPHNFTGSNKPFIFYYFKNASNNKPIRIRKYLSKHKGDIKKIKVEAKNRVLEIIELLKSNWNPVEQKQNKLTINPLSTINECIQEWLKVREIAYSNRSIGKTTFKNNKILMSYLIEFLNKQSLLSSKASNITNVHLKEFLDEKSFERNWGKVTYNTYKIDLGTFFNYLMDLNIIKENPVRKIQNKSTKSDSSRFKVFELEELRRVAELLSVDKAFEGLHIAAKLLFKYNIRPVEITRLQVKDINWNKQILTLPPEKTKNGNEARFSLDNESITLLKEYLKGVEADYFIFCGRNKPSLSQTHCDYFGQRWRAFRAKYKLPHHLKFYALKHSSNYYDIENGHSYEEIRQRNRHSNLQVTTLYIKERLFKNIIKPSNSSSF